MLSGTVLITGGAGVLGDIQDTERLSVAMIGADVVIHAAALKYVPEAEANVQEAVRVNVYGALSVIIAARRAGVPVVVGISTDKAVQPVNSYGATKMVMERLFQGAADEDPSGPLFLLVRYGNVVGSTGSVIPLFQRQIRETGRVTLTNRGMTRFWLSPQEAVDLILAALENPQTGTIIVPAPKAMTMENLVTALFLGDGLHEPQIDDIPVRPGEKLHEDLVHRQESIRALPFQGSSPSRQGGIRLLSPTHPPVNKEPFSVSSLAPPGGWLSFRELNAMLAEVNGVLQ
jgi:UDP-N-acetylglucosamine 4,6-dehydratase